VNTADNTINANKATMDNLTKANNTLTKDNGDQKSQINNLQGQLNDVQGKLAAIMPAPNVYLLDQNRSQMVPYDHMSIGLVGNPRSDSVDLNINGKQYTAAVGDVITIPIEQTMTCQVRIISSSVLKAQAEVNAACVQTTKQ
jgi:hypothetical protein